jgi:glycine/D-amino acid oxidase-like deaminating enzyme
MDQTPIVIVGAGVAGLVCAIELQRAGRQVVVLEGGGEVGGRVRSTHRDGLTLDHGFQVLFTAYPVLGRYLDLAALDLRRFAPAARIVTRDGVSLVGDALRDPTLLVDTIRARALPVGDKLRMLALRRFALSLSVDDCFSARFDAVSTRTFLEGRGFSAAAIDGFFAPFYGGILLDRSLATSASILLFTFRMLAAGDTAVPARGMGAITAQLASRLERGTVRTGVRVRAVHRAGDAAAGVVLDDGTMLAASDVVLATDAPGARDLAASAGVTLTVPDGALGCTTLYYRSDSLLLPGTALWLNAVPEAVVSHAVTLTEVAPEYADAGHLLAATAVGAAADLPDDTLDAAARADLLRMARPLGGDAVIPLTLAGVWRVPYAQFAQPPGTRARRPSIQCGVRGLWRASEVLHSSSLDGAARGGRDAALAVLGTASATTDRPT